MQHIDFLTAVVPAKAVCLSFLVITCIGTKAKKDRDLKVSSIVV
ncbi:MAG: YWFCY domain-containing protein, partial [Draconibacterium sp.]